MQGVPVGFPIHIDSHYSRTGHQSDGFSSLEGEVEAEVCVIGGGLAGLNTALGLAKRGHRAVLLEAKRIGWGASGRNGGFVAPGFALSAEALNRKVGMAQGRELHGLTSDAMALIRARIEDFAIDCDVVDGVVVASWFDRAEEMAKAATFCQEFLGERCELWPREQLREAYRSERYYEGLFFPNFFHMHPLNYCLGLAKAAAAAGAQIHEGSEVVGLDLSGPVKRVSTDKGRISAQHVVFCCSGYIGALFQPLARATLPVGTYVMVTEPLGDNLKKAVRAPYALADNRFAQDYYRPLPEGRLLWGGRVRALKPPRDLSAAMLGDLLKVYPQLEGISADVAWEGTMGYATHKMPQIGQLKPGIWYCMGFGGHGLCPTTCGGELIAAAIAEGDDRYRLFAPFGLSYTGGLLGRYVTQCVYWSYELRDQFRR